MAINLKRTCEVHTDGIKALIFGESGAGKTTLFGTLPGNVLILSAEAGLLSLGHKDIAYIEIKTIDDLYEAYSFITEGEGQEFDTIAIDSISEIADVLLAHEMRENADGRKAYGELNTKIAEIVRRFRDLPGRSVYMSAMLDKTQDDMGRLLYSPAMPGKKAAQKLPYQFDLVLALRVETDQEGNRVRALQTQPDGVWLAKDRSGRLDFWEPADLGAVIAKIKGGVEA